MAHWAETRWGPLGPDEGQQCYIYIISATGNMTQSTPQHANGTTSPNGRGRGEGGGWIAACRKISIFSKRCSYTSVKIKLPMIGTILKGVKLVCFWLIPCGGWGAVVVPRLGIRGWSHRANQGGNRQHFYSFWCDLLRIETHNLLFSRQRSSQGGRLGHRTTNPDPGKCN